MPRAEHQIAWHTRQDGPEIAIDWVRWRPCILQPFKNGSARNARPHSFVIGIRGDSVPAIPGTDSQFKFALTGTGMHNHAVVVTCSWAQAGAIFTRTQTD